MISWIRVYTSIQDVSWWVCQAIRDALCHISGVITLGTFLYFNEKFLLHLLSKRLLECAKIYGWAIVFSFSSSMLFFSCRGASKNNCFVCKRKCLSRVMRFSSVWREYSSVVHLIYIVCISIILIWKNLWNKQNGKTYWKSDFCSSTISKMQKTQRTRKQK